MSAAKLKEAEQAGLAGAPSGAGCLRIGTGSEDGKVAALAGCLSWGDGG